MHSSASDRAFNLEAWLVLQELAFGAVKSRMQCTLAKAELERIKDDSVIALFKVDGCLCYPRLVSEART
jgi:hypothetical protein